MKSNKISLSLKLAILAVASIMVSHVAIAQYQGVVYKQYYDSATVLSNTGIALSNPWQGGLNSLCPSLADLNNDRKLDLVCYDKNNNRVFTFINKGTSGNAKYIYNPGYEINFPKNIYGYLLLRDYNNDNVMDLFHRGSSGVEIYKGYIQNDSLKFVHYKEVWYSGSFGPVNAYVQPGDIPTIRDIDKDGDLDILAWDLFGTTLEYYKNVRIEQGLPPDSFVVQYQAGCYGKAIQTSWRTLILNASCKGFEPNGVQVPDTSLFDNCTIDITSDPNAHLRKTRHVGNCFDMVDLNGDNDLDLLGGNISFHDVQMAEWQGNKFIKQDTTWDKNSSAPVWCPLWPAPQNIDVNQDGKSDLVFCAHLERTNSQYAANNEFLYYKNISTGVAPTYSLQTRELLFEDIIDIGLNSYPTFFDFNKDGYKDLFVGGDGMVDTGNNFKLSSKIAYYKNVSYNTGGQSKFELVTKDFLGLFGKKLDGAFPHFGDITGDGISDLLIGTNTGKIVAYQNTANSQAAIPNFVLLSDSFANINLGSYAAPCVFDIDYDGVKDIIIGAIDGSLHFYQGSNTGGVTTYTFVTDTLGGVKVGGKYFAYGYAAPYFGRIDNVNRPQLIIGTGDGTIERYDSFQTPILGKFLQLDSVYSYIKSPIRAVVACADIDKDGYFEMVVGSKMGGLSYYRQTYLLPDVGGFPDDDTITSIGYNTHQNYWQVYPNPTNGIINVNTSSSDVYNITVYDIAGRIVTQRLNCIGNHTQIELPASVKGTLLYQVTSKSNNFYGKLLVQ